MNLISSHAYFLVFHGSRDCRTQTAANKLRVLLIERCQSLAILTQQNYLEKFSSDSALDVSTVSEVTNTPLIEVAPLELTPISLSQSLINFAQKSEQQGIRLIKVIPLFLAPGVHVREDIPHEIALAEKQIDNQVQIKLSPYIGKYSGIVALLTRNFSSFPGKTRILIAHGSRLPGVKAHYQNLAVQLGAELCYWSMEPKFCHQIKACIESGSKKITILPYFLFPGRITEAIAKEIAKLQQHYPEIEFYLGEPFGATKAVSELIAEEA